MKRTFLLVPVFEHARSASIASALVHLFEKRKISTSLCQPGKPSLLARFETQTCVDDAVADEIERSVAHGGRDDWLTSVVENLQNCARDVDVLVVAAPAPSHKHPFVSFFNRELVRALNAEVILLADLTRPMGARWSAQIALAAGLYARENDSRVVGCVLDRAQPDEGEPLDVAITRIKNAYGALGPNLPQLIAVVPEHQTLLSSSTNIIDDTRVVDESTFRAETAFVSRHLDGAWIDERWTRAWEQHVSPPAFYARLKRQARNVNRRIILPESTDPRILRAAATCARLGIAQCVLLGDPEAIKRAAGECNIELPGAVEIVDANAIRPDYVKALVELRDPEHLSLLEAEQQLHDDGLLATMLLASGKVDGLVSGAVDSSAATVRAALQIVKSRPGVKRASSIFFMCLPDQVVVYGDCAVNPDPDPETLAEIAIESAETALRFGLPARVAMLSYATEKSGSGPDVDKVWSATRLARTQRPDLSIDGPLQYDAAAVADVAHRKAPSSPVAGRASVFIFPDLDTGNITYKAVQHSAGIVCIGPMLQGLRRPVSDLSRGASVEDIVFTVAATAVQAATQ